MTIETISPEQTSDPTAPVEETSVPTEQTSNAPELALEMQDAGEARIVNSAPSAAETAASEAASAASLKELLLGTKPKVLASAETMIGLPWIVGVTAVVEAWPDMKPASRKNFLVALAAQQTEPARRFRLSLGRGMLPHDAGAALALIASVCAEMIESGNGVPSQKDRQIFANVLIGKGKPWLLHLPLGEIEDRKRCARSHIAPSSPASPANVLPSHSVQSCAG